MTESEVKFEIMEVTKTNPAFRNVNFINRADRKKAIQKVILSARSDKEFWISDFLKIKTKNTRKTYAGYLKQFFSVFGETHPLDLSMNDIKRALSDVILDSSKGITYKQGFTTAVRTFFEGMIYDFNSALQSFGVPQRYWKIMPVPPTSRLPPIKDDPNKKTYGKVLSPKEVDQCLKISHSSGSKEIELNMEIIATTACRQSESRSILIENCHLDEPEYPYIITGVIEGCMKSNPKGNPNRKLIYPISKRLAFKLKRWIDVVKANNPDEIWLFPAQTEEGFICSSTINNFIKDYVRPNLENKDAKEGLTSHWFRHSMINNRRIYKGCDFLTSQILQYHKTNNTQLDVYTHFSLEERMKIWWDKYPYNF